ncbi:hypothetical protein [Streptomyces sp. NPDC099088]|uniref:hypothetical protein n=1 Tax=Streptomyces sp. NPDC099088 TaxID=3366101 RepID=UPI0037FDAC2D
MVSPAGPTRTSPAPASPHECNGKRVRCDQLDVPDSFGEGLMCLIDRNGSFPSACSAVPLAPNKLLHTGPVDVFDKSNLLIDEIIVADIGAGTDGWEFSGSSYTVELR